MIISSIIHLISFKAMRSILLYHRENEYIWQLLLLVVQKREVKFLLTHCCSIRIVFLDKNV
jgi:hypothetical protein